MSGDKPCGTVDLNKAVEHAKANLGQFQTAVDRLKAPRSSVAKPQADEDYEAMVTAWVGVARDLARKLGFSDDDSKGSTQDWKLIEQWVETRLSSVATSEAMLLGEIDEKLDELEVPTMIENGDGLRLSRVGRISLLASRSATQENCGTVRMEAAVELASEAVGQFRAAAEEGGDKPQGPNVLAMQVESLKAIFAAYRSNDASSAEVCATVRSINLEALLEAVQSPHSSVAENDLGDLTQACVEEFEKSLGRNLPGRQTAIIRKHIEKALSLRSARLEPKVTELLADMHHFLSHTGNHRAIVGDSFSKPSIRYDTLRSLTKRLGEYVPNTTKEKS